MAQLIGLARIGRDAELRYTQDGTPVAGVSLAFNFGKKDPGTGNRPTQWVDASVWGPRAEALAPYLLKGTLIQVTIDDPHIETFQRQDNTQGHKMAGRISSLEFASRPPESQGQTQQQAPQRPASNDYQRTREGSAPQRPAQGGGGAFADLSDDIPFNRHHGGRNWACFQ